MWTSSEARCGIASYTASLVQELGVLGVEVDLVGVPYTDRDPARRRADLDRLNAADLIHLQHEYTFFGGIAPGASSLPTWLRGLHRPHVVTAHTVFTARELLRVDLETRPRQRLAKRILAALPQFRRSVERTPFAGASAWIVHTEAARERFRRQQFPAERIHVLPAGIPPVAEAGGGAAEVEALRRRLGWGPGRVVAIFGYITPDKGYELALEAVGALPTPVHLLIAGGTRVEHERAYLDQLEARIAASKLAARTAITGYLTDPEVRTAMELADLVLVPHTAANGSYSVMVALGHGRPVLAADLACFREIQERTGSLDLFQAGDARSLQDRLAFLLASAGTRRQLAEKARAFAEEQSWASVAKQTAGIYREWIGSGK